jgi:hypothetical protein
MVQALARSGTHSLSVDAGFGASGSTPGLSDRNGLELQEKLRRATKRASPFERLARFHFRPLEARSLK